MTLKARLAGHDNALNLLRLVLAIAVIFNHSWPLGGFGHDPSWGDKPIGQWSVAGFFAISGFLIAGSRSRLEVLPFLWRRALRIMPGFWVCLVVVAFGFAPLVSAITGEAWSRRASLEYVIHNAALHIERWGIPTTLAHNPYPTVWNGSLWSLEIEFDCYLIAAALFLILQRARQRAIGFAALTVVASVGAFFVGMPEPYTLVWLLSFFAAGMTVWAVADRLPASWKLAGACVAVLVVAALLNRFTLLGPFPMAYLLLYLGGRLPWRFGSTHDISYGVYVYAFPVQQLLASAGLHRLVPWPDAFSLIALAATIPLAALSWFAVERPALRLKKLVGSKRSVAAAGAG